MSDLQSIDWLWPIPASITDTAAPRNIKSQLSLPRMHSQQMHAKFMRRVPHQSTRQPPIDNQNNLYRMLHINSLLSN